MNLGAVHNNQRWSCQGTSHGGCVAHSTPDGEVNAHTCSDTRGNRWQCAVSRLLEVLHGQLLGDAVLPRTPIDPEDVDYEEIAQHILNYMGDSSRQPGVEFPVAETATFAALTAHHPWMAYNRIEDWLRVLYLTYGNDPRGDEALRGFLAQAPEGETVAGTLLRQVTRILQGPLERARFSNQLKAWCRESVWRFDHTTMGKDLNVRCPASASDAQRVRTIVSTYGTQPYEASWMKASWDPARGTKRKEREEVVITDDPTDEEEEEEVLVVDPPVPIDAPVPDASIVGNVPLDVDESSSEEEEEDATPPAPKRMKTEDDGPEEDVVDEFGNLVRRSRFGPPVPIGIRPPARFMPPAPEAPPTGVAKPKAKGRPKGKAKAKGKTKGKAKTKAQGE